MAEIPNRPNPLSQYSNIVASNITGSTIVSGSKVVAARLVDQATGATGSYSVFTGSMHVGEIYLLAPTGGTSPATIVFKLKTGSSATTCGVYSGSISYYGEAPIA